MKDPRRNIPLSLALGTGIVIGLYLLANVAYLVTLPFDAIQHAPSDRVATATLDAIFPGLGATMMAVAIMISTFGCNNGLILAGARAYYAMARDGLFFRSAGHAERGQGAGVGAGAAGRLGGVPGAAAHLQSGDRHLRQPLRQPARLRHLGGADLLHPDHRRDLPPARDAARRRPRPYRAFGYPVVPALYIVGALAILLVLFVYRPATTWPGLSSCCWACRSTSPGRNVDLLGVCSEHAPSTLRATCSYVQGAGDDAADAVGDGVAIEVGGIDPGGLGGIVAGAQRAADDGGSGSRATTKWKRTPPSASRSTRS